MATTKQRIVRETRHLRVFASDSGTGPSYRIETKRCALCDTPREDMLGKRLADHLERECEATPG